MNLMKWNVIVVLIIVIFLASCGEGSSKNENETTITGNNAEITDLISKTGILVDSPIQGMKYVTTSGMAGFTNHRGEYKYNPGDKVKFYLGEIEFPEIECNEVVTPLELFGVLEPSNTSVVNFIRLIQTLDDDGDSNGSIDISKSVFNNNNLSKLKYSDFLLSQEEFENTNSLKDLFTDLGIKKLIDKEIAMNHFLNELTNSQLIDSDSDGLTNSEDVDDDNDGVTDSTDDFPLNVKEIKDTDKDGKGDNEDEDDDNDGIADAMDKFPLNFNESKDFDNDGIGDNTDEDDDNDGITDAIDKFPFNNKENKDFDGDGIGDIADEDDDNDGIADAIDKFPFNNKENKDFDGDGIGDIADEDDDNDGIADAMDKFPFNNKENKDFDGDGIGDIADEDDDNDGIADAIDKFPFNNKENKDFDGDGIGDIADEDDDNDGIADAMDKFPFNIKEDKDYDNDGIGDNADEDDDNDGTIDSNDKFPLNSSEQLDTDNDGVGNNSDLDDDQDGIKDSEDKLPLDKNEFMDTDNDGLGDNADLDDDNDGYNDISDKFPKDSHEHEDSDNDGIGDNGDKFPFDPNETKDFDNDGIGNNADLDDDNDGVEDISDAFPLDNTETKDNDNDGLGDNSDEDDDNDGTIDSNDAYQFNSSNFSKSFVLSINITDLKFDTKRRKAFATDKANKKLRVINLDEGVIEKTITFDYMAERMAVSPDGNKLYVALLLQEHSPYWWTENQSGYIAEINLNTLEVNKTISISIDPYDLAINASGKLVVSSGSGQWTAIQAIDANNGSLLGKASIGHASRLCMDYANGFVFTANTQSFPSDIQKYNINGTGIVYMSDSPYHGDHRMDGNIWVTSNGEKLITRGGDLYNSDMTYVKNITKTSEFIENLNFDNLQNALFIINSNKEIVYYNSISFEYIDKISNITNPKWLILLKENMFAVTYSNSNGEFEFIKLKNPVFGFGTNQAPIASFTTSFENGDTCMNLLLDGSNSSDEDASTLQYRWDINNDGIWETEFSTQKNFSHKYLLAGTKIIKLQVKDKCGLTSSFTKSVEIANGTDYGTLVNTGTQFQFDLIITDLAVDKTRTKAYFTVKYEKRMYVLNLTTGMIEKYFEFENMVERIAISTDNSKLYLTLLAKEHSSYWWDEDQYGYIAVFNLDISARVNAFKTNRDPYDVVASNNKIVVSSGSGQWTDIYAYSASDFSVLGSASIRQASRLDIHPSGNFVIAANTDTSPSDIEKFDLTVSGITAMGDSPYHGDHRMNGNVFISTDGNSVVTRGGDIYFTSNLNYIKGLSPNGVNIHDVSFNTTNGTIIFIGSNDYIYKFDLTTLTQISIKTNISNPDYIIEIYNKIYIVTYSDGTTKLVEISF